MLLTRRQPDKPAAAANNLCSIRTLNELYTEFGIDPGIKQDGIYGSETHTALMDAVADDDDGKEQPETEKPEVQTPATKQVRIVCASGSVNIRVGNDTKYSRITSVKDGATFEWIATAENGWHAIVVNAQVGWVSGKYSQVV